MYPYDDAPPLTPDQRVAGQEAAKIRRMTVLLEDCVSLMARWWWPPAGDVKRKKAALITAVTQELTRP
jgi:hypothetical protein